jgi:hypothetical protein
MGKKGVKKIVEEIEGYAIPSDNDEPSNNTDKKAGACAVWEIRINLDLYDAMKLNKLLLKFCKKWAFQGEMGDSGYKHWQGRISLIKKKFKNELIKTFELYESPIPNYLQPTTNEEHRKGAGFYVLKDETRIKSMGPYTDANWRDILMDDDEVDYDELLSCPEVFRPYTLDHIRFNNLYPYQKLIAYSGLKKHREPRKIDLVIDDGRGKIGINGEILTGGGEGKSTIATYLRIGGHAIDMPACNDFDRLIFTLCDILKDRRNHDPKIILFDLPRAMTKNKLYGFVSAFEQIKKGYLYDTRNKFNDWEIHPPRIWVFCNEMIDLSLLSQDRWNLWFIDDNKELQPLNVQKSIEKKIVNSLDDIVDDTIVVKNLGHCMQICTCSEPKLELMKCNNRFWCDNCRKWEKKPNDTV